MTPQQDHPLVAPVEQDALVAALTAHYAHRRQQGESPRPHDVLAIASEFTASRIDALTVVLVFYRALGDSDESASADSGYAV